MDVGMEEAHSDKRLGFEENCTAEQDCVHDRDSSSAVLRLLDNRNAVFESGRDMEVGRTYNLNGAQATINYNNYGTPIPSPTPNADKLKYEALKDSLKFEGMDARLRNILPPLSKTCEWVFTHPAYRRWETREGDTDHTHFLWVKGKPGCGKSTIMKTILSRILKEQANGLITASYFFNARVQNTLEKSSIGLYRSIVYQILCKCPYFMQTFLSNFDSKLQDGRVEDWTENELQGFLAEIMTDSGRPLLCFIIDALDEGDENDIRNMVEFLQDIAVGAQTGPALCICISSRHYPNIFVKGLSMVIEDQTEHNQDIELYVSKKLRNAPDASMDELRTAICRKSASVFLWVVLVIPMINKAYDRGKGFAALEDYLEHIPESLEALFADILSRDSDDSEDCLSLFQWVLFSVRPLSLLELYIACQCCRSRPPGNVIDPPDGDHLSRYLLNASHGLVEQTRTKRPVVQFIHESVRDFLLGKNGLIKLGNVDLMPSRNIYGYVNDKLARNCWNYITSSSNSLMLSMVDAIFTAPTVERRHKSMNAFLKAYPYITYAVHSVLLHADRAQANDVSQQQFISSFRQHGNVPDPSWLKLQNVLPGSHYPRKVSLPYIFADQGLTGLMQLIMKEAETQGVKLDVGINALRQAVSNGHEVMVGCLAECGVDINAKSSSGANPLFIAVRRSFKDVTRVLIEKGADVNAQYGNGESLLHLAAKFNEDAAIAGLLIKGGADVNARDTHGKTPLHQAVQCLKGPAVATLLIEQRSEVNARDLAGRTPLHVVTELSGLPAAFILPLLLDHGADVNAVSNDLDTPLCTVSRVVDAETFVQTLLDYGADVNLDAGRGTALYWASKWTHAKVVQTLIDNGADVNLQTRFGETALQAVLYPSRGRFMRDGKSLMILLLLLKAGAGRISGKGWDVAISEEILKRINKISSWWHEDQENLRYIHDLLTTRLVQKTQSDQ